MIDTKQLAAYAQHPELALQNLPELLALLDSSDENARNYATEALENCGKPTPDQIPWLVRELNSSQASRIYWSATLLGRLGDEIEATHRCDIQTELAKTACNSSIDLAARERSAWALGELGRLPEGVKNELTELVGTATPRLKRLMEAALSQ
jgi:hypothetical protein